jgi:hypothetical protein
MGQLLDGALPSPRITIFAPIVGGPWAMPTEQVEAHPLLVTAEAPEASDAHAVAAPAAAPQRARRRRTRATIDAGREPPSAGGEVEQSKGAPASEGVAADGCGVSKGDAADRKARNGRVQ